MYTGLSRSIDLVPQPVLNLVCWLGGSILAPHSVMVGMDGVLVGLGWESVCISASDTDSVLGLGPPDSVNGLGPTITDFENGLGPIDSDEG